MAEVAQSHPAPDPPLAAPAAAERVLLFEELRRNRRAVWRVTAIAAVSVVLMGLALGLVIMPLLYALLLLAGNLVNLVVPLPHSATAAMQALAELIPTMADAIGKETPVPASLKIEAITALLLPGAVTMVLIWMWLRRLLFRGGADAVLPGLKARPPHAGDMEEEQVSNVVAEISVAAGITHPPRVMILDSAAANAGIIGASVDSATIMVSRGLLDGLDRAETQAVIANVVASAANGDLDVASEVMAALYSFYLVVTLLNTPFGPKSRAAVRSLLRLDSQKSLESGGRDVRVVTELLAAQAGESDDLDGWIDAQSSRSRIRAMLGLPLLLTFGWMCITARLTLLFTMLVFFGPITMAVWDKRRRLADTTTVRLTRNPNGLGRALDRLSQLPTDIEGGNSVRYLFAVWKNSSGYGFLESFWFHPSFPRRLRHLRTLGSNVFPYNYAAVRASYPQSVAQWALLVFVGILLVVAAIFGLIGVTMLLGLNLLFSEIALLLIQAIFGHLTGS